MQLEFIDCIANFLLAGAYLIITGQLFTLVKCDSIFFKHTGHNNNNQSAQSSAKKNGLLILILSIGLLYGAFILLCGITHATKVITYTYPNTKGLHLAATVLLVICAIVSCATAIAGYKVFPAILNVLNKLELSDEGQIQHLENYIINVINLFNESIVILNTDGKIERGNSSSAKFFGKSFISASVYDFIHPDDKERFRLATQSVSRGYDFCITIEYRVLDQLTSSGFIWVESKLNKRVGMDYSVVYELNMITRDVNERKKQAHFERLSLSAKTEANMNAAKLRYITCTAHDLKTPIHSFNFALELLVNTGLNAKQTELVSAAAVSVDLMRLTIAQAMDIGKALTGTVLTPRCTSVSLASIMKRVQNNYKWLRKASSDLFPHLGCYR